MTELTSPERRVQTRSEALIFRGKTFLLQCKRAFEDRFRSRVSRFSKSDALAGEKIVSRSRTPLWTETEPAERFLVAGKINNLRIAVRELDGLEVPAGEIFSFWKHVGRASRFRGYVA